MMFRRRPQPEAEIPTASMADIAFLLIVFFMVSTTLLEEKGLPLILPESGQQKKVPSKNIVHVVIGAEGNVKIDGFPIDISAVKDDIEDKLEARPGTLIVSVKTHPDCPYGTMIDVFDELKLAQAERISLVPPTRE
jgi:biopolymer transport protein ExbD